MANRAEYLKHQYEGSVGLPLARLLPPNWLEQAMEEQGYSYRESVYTPVVTLWAWIAQVLSPDKSLQNTVAQIVSWLVAGGMSPPSSDTGAYSKARQRLPQPIIEQVFASSVAVLEETISPRQLWCGRRVITHDGTGVSLLDTPANQAVFPQSSRQQPGCGYPLVRLVVWFCLATGAVVQVALSSFQTSEWELARSLYGSLVPGDIRLADSAYGTYVDLALLKQNQADGVFRKHHARACDFRTGHRLGKDDHLVEWGRPAQSALSPEELASLPETLTVREVRFTVSTPGFRPKQVVVVTTLLDPQRYSKEALATLYRWRWSAAEVNLRHLKTTLKMDLIQVKTPEMAVKDLWIHLLTYNLLRLLMRQSAQLTGADPLRLSLQGIRQMFNQFRSLLALAAIPDRQQRFHTLLLLLAQEIVPLRPDRCEPRVLKRRPKSFPRMQQPRALFKRSLAD